MQRARTSLFDFAVVDEAQDISVAHLRFFAALAEAGPMPSSSRAILGSASSSSPSPGRPSAWIFAGVRARLRVNYRTSHQIRTQADRLLGSE